MMIFGGTSYPQLQKQISNVEGCSLRRVGNLPLENFISGGCNTFQDGQGNDEILLCFSSTTPWECHKYQHDS